MLMFSDELFVMSDIDLDFFFYSGTAGAFPQILEGMR